MYTKKAELALGCSAYQALVNAFNSKTATMKSANGHPVTMFRSYIEFTRFDMPKHSALDAIFNTAAKLQQNFQLRK